MVLYSSSLFYYHSDKEEQVLAMFSYTAQNEDELTFYKGSVISVISKDGEWWKGEMNGEVGVFPFNYVQSLRNENEVTSQCKWSVNHSLLDYCMSFFLLCIIIYYKDGFSLWSDFNFEEKHTFINW